MSVWESKEERERYWKERAALTLSPSHRENPSATEATTTRWKQKKERERERERERESGKLDEGRLKHTHTHVLAHTHTHTHTHAHTRTNSGRLKVSLYESECDDEDEVTHAHVAGLVGKSETVALAPSPPTDVSPLLISVDVFFLGDIFFSFFFQPRSMVKQQNAAIKTSSR